MILKANVLGKRSYLKYKGLVIRQLDAMICGMAVYIDTQVSRLNFKGKAGFQSAKYRS